MRRDVPAATVRAAVPKPATPLDDGPWEVSAVGTKYRASAAPRGRGADWDNARAYFRAPDVSAWMIRMRTDPDVFTRILSDIFRETRAEQARRARQARIGRRPKVIDGALGELWDIMTPRYSNETFRFAVVGVTGGLSPAEVGARTGLGTAAYERMLAGQGLEMWRLETIARAFNLSPAYFLEWRQGYILTVIAELLCLQPGLSIRWTRALDGAVGPVGPSRKARQLARSG